MTWNIVLFSCLCRYKVSRAYEILDMYSLPEVLEDVICLYCSHIDDEYL